MIKYNSTGTYKIEFPDGLTYIFTENEFIELLKKSKFEYDGIERKFSVIHIQNDIFIRLDDSFRQCVEIECDEDDNHNVICEKYNAYKISNDFLMHSQMPMYYVPYTNKRLRILFAIE